MPEYRETLYGGFGRLAALLPGDVSALVRRVSKTMDFMCLNVGEYPTSMASHPVWHQSLDGRSVP
jgi:hypothetical protein